MSEVYIRVERPEGYEDVHPDLVAEDFVRAAGVGFAWSAAPPQPEVVTDEMVEAACKTFSEESLGYSSESRREYMIRYMPIRAALVAALRVGSGGSGS